MKKKLLFLLSLLLLLPSLTALGDGIVKDETVYALLDASGGVAALRVVSRIETPEDGDYTDYGAYDDIAAMTVDLTPAIDGDAITWTLPANPKGFYAVGTPSGAELPFAVRITYRLNGEPIPPEDLAGQSGAVEITLALTANAASAEVFRTRYAAQIQVPLSLNTVQDVTAPGASSALVGQTLTLTYTVLPGNDAAYTLTMQAQDFHMDGITIALAEMDLGGMLGIDLSQIEGQITQLADGASALADGAASLESGLTQVLSMLGALPEKAAQLAAGAGEAASGADTYIASVNSAADSLAIGAAELSGAADALGDALAPLLASLDPEDQAALQAQLDALKTAAAAYALSAENARSQLAEGGTAISEGLAAQNTGATALSTSIKLLVTQTASMPEGLASLTSGSRQLSDGIGQAAGMLKDTSLFGGGDLPIHSFVSPEHAARSVQFVFMTEAIAVEAETVEAEPEAASLTFWERFTQLFQ